MTVGDSVIAVDRNISRFSRAARSARRCASTRVAPPRATAKLGASVLLPSETAMIRPSANPLAMLLTRHLLRDGEIILLVLKPSLWFITLSSLRFIALTLIAAIGIKLWLSGHTHYYVESLVFCLAGRLMFATLTWINRVYILTDQRVLRLGGVLSPEISDCPLRKVATVRLVSPFREKVTGVGTLEIVPTDEGRPCSFWQTVKRPKKVCEQVELAIRRAKST